jgi:hypothetical protein
MSAKNTLYAKKIRRLERALKKGRLPKWMDLLQWAQDHGHADTAGAARKLISEDRIRYASHPLGKKTIDLPGEQFGKIQVLDPRVPSHLRSSISVSN